LSAESSATPSLGQGEGQPQPGSSLPWLIPLALIELVFLGVYWSAATFATSCGSDEFGPIGYAHNGQPKSVTAAVVLAASVWVGAGVALYRFPRWRRGVFGLGSALYAAGLGVLWAMSPLIWGAGVCPGVPVSHVSGQVGRLLEGHTDTIESVAFSPNRRLLASSSDDGTIRLWDVRSQRELGRPLWHYRGVINAVAFSPDGREIASGACDGTVRLWDVRTHRQLGSALLAGRDRACVNGLAFSPDGRMLVSGSDFGDGRVRLWDVRRHTQLGSAFGQPGNGFNDVAFSPDSHTVVAAVNVHGYWGAVVLWDVRSHRQLGQPGRVGLQVLTVAFSPNGRLIASGDAKGGVRLWNARGRRRRGALYENQLEMVQGVAFNRDGHTLAACFHFGTLRVWDVRSQRKLADREIEATSLAFSRDGRMLAIGDSDGTIRLLRSP
jgi:WD40 repeat protein